MTVIAPETGSFNLHVWLENQSKSPLNLGRVFSDARTEKGKEKREEQGPGSGYLVYQCHTRGSFSHEILFVPKELSLMNSLPKQFLDAK